MKSKFTSILAFLGLLSCAFGQTKTVSVNDTTKALAYPTATQFKTANGLLIGTNLEAWNATLDTLSGKSFTGSGLIPLQTSPSFITPALGAATATTINKLTLTAPATGSTLTILDGKTFTLNNTLTLSGTDGSTLNIGTGGTLGTGAYATAFNPAAPGAIGGTTPSTGAFTTVNKLTLTAPATSATLTIADGATLATSGAFSLTLTATATTNATFPAGSGTLIYSGGALGTPSSGVATNLTGTASGLTAGNVTTNANLTGPVTSSGNATTITAASVTNAMLAGSIDLTSKVTNALPATNGGTGTATYTQGDILYSSATNTLSKLAAGTAGQVLQTGGAGANPSWVTVSSASLTGVNNLVANTDGTSPLSKIDVTADEAILKNSSGVGVVVTSPVAMVDMALSGVSGLDTGAEASSTWYYVWLLRKTTPIVSASVTCSSSAGLLVTHTAHGMADNTPVSFQAAGMPGGLVAGTIYYIRDQSTNSYRLATTPQGTAIAFSSAGTTVVVSEGPCLVLSLSATAPTLPTNYTYKGLLSAVRNDGSSNFLAYKQYGKSCAFGTTILVQSSAAGSNSVVTSQSLSSAVPPSAIFAVGYIQVVSTTTSLNIQIATSSAATNAYAAAYGAASGFGTSFFRIPMITSQTLYYVSVGVTTVYNLGVTGFELP